MLVRVVAVLALFMVSIVAWAGPASAGSESIVARWTDADGNTVLLREGTYRDGKGFGWKKIQARHKIRKVSSLRFVISNPAGGEPQGSNRVYLAYATRKECSGSYCRYTDSLPVRVVVDFRSYGTYYDATVDGELGVMTAYCMNPDKALECPSWVDAALGNPSGQAVSGLEERGVVLSYHPLVPVNGG